MAGTEATTLLLSTQSQRPCFYSSTSLSKNKNLVNSFSGDEGESCFVLPNPVIDYSMLISGDVLQRSKAISDLNEACLNFGFFTVTNHGIPDSLMGSVMNWLSKFFYQNDEEKRRYETNDSKDKIRFRWGGRTQRELLHMRVHPTFHCPTKPANSTVLQEYCEKMREMGVQLLRGISKSLGLEEDYIEKKMNLESGYNVFGPNYYPALSHSSDDKNQIGQFPHRDPGLLVLLAQDVDGGLQIEHQKKWFNANFPPSSIFVIVADHIEILTNGKYKSLLHRVALTNEVERKSLPFFFGPSLEATVRPAPEFVDEHNPPSYREMTYKDYLESNKHDVIEARANLNQIRI